MMEVQLLTVSLVNCSVAIASVIRLVYIRELNTTTTILGLKLEFASGHE